MRAPRAALLTTDLARRESMRVYHDIRLADRTVDTRELTGEAIVKAGRYLITKTLLEMDAAGVDPPSPASPPLFSPRPLPGPSFSNAHPTRAGGKRPPTRALNRS